MDLVRVSVCGEAGVGLKNGYQVFRVVNLSVGTLTVRHPTEIHHARLSEEGILGFRRRSMLAFERLEIGS